MKTRTYRADNLKDALARVRRDLGGSAVILGTREVRQRRLPVLKARTRIEVTAAPGWPSESLTGSSASVSASEASGQETGRFPASAPDPAARAESSVRSAPKGAKPPLDDRLSQLHAHVDGLNQAGRLEHLLFDLPTELVPVYARLLDLDVPEALARRLVRFVAETVEPVELGHPDAIAQALRTGVERCLPIAPPMTSVPGQCKMVALVGPTGVGKTTTVAKLAAVAKIHRGLRVGLLTIDTYRIAAAEQLRTYAEILDLPLAVAETPAGLDQAIEALGPIDLVLIDSAGRSPHDAVKIRELAAFLEQARADEVHLVVSATTTERDLSAAVERFEPLGTNRLLVTKLDEAERLGGLLGLSAGVPNPKPISYLTTGQAVPDDIEPADRRRLAALILGDEAVG